MALVIGHLPHARDRTFTVAGDRNPRSSDDQ